MQQASMIRRDLLECDVLHHYLNVLRGVMAQKIKAVPQGFSEPLINSERNAGGVKKFE